MLSERNRAIVGRDRETYTITAADLDRYLDAARAEGGAGEGLATRQLTAPGSTAPPEASNLQKMQNAPGGVEELVERLKRDAERLEACSGYAAHHGTPGARDGERWNGAFAADLRALARLLEERTRALEEIARGEVPPEKEGHYLAHRAAVKRARQALSIVRKEKGSSQGCPTSSAPPFANHAHEVPAAGAVSPGGAA